MLLRNAVRDTAPIFTVEQYGSHYQTALLQNTNTQLRVSFNKQAFIKIKQTKNNREEWLGKQLQLSVKRILAEERSNGKPENSLLRGAFKL